MELHIFNTAEEAIIALADFFVEKVNEAITENGESAVSLSGGRSPQKLYELLASPEYKNKIDWRKVYFFFGDERYVPFTDPDYNGAMVKKALFDELVIPDEQIFYIDTSLPPKIASSNYEAAIYSYFGDRPVRFDVFLLGLGDNAHTASLFPHTPVLKEQKKLVSAVLLEDQKAIRITMTAALINESQNIAFLVFGDSKAKAVKQVIEEEKNIDNYPAQIIEPENGSVHWFLDQSAASGLSAKILNDV
jgi:6-phosphogluconolactonase